MGTTFSDYLNDVLSIEAKLIGVLGIVGVQSSAVRSSGLRFGSTCSRRRLHLLWTAPVYPTGEKQGLLVIYGWSVYWSYWWPQLFHNTGSLQAVSPCGTLIGNIHKAHILVLMGTTVMATLVLEAGQGRLLHARLLSQQRASGVGAALLQGSTPSGARCWWE